jgi:uncharacterized coiled-coil DUF342 family protein
MQSQGRGRGLKVVDEYSALGDEFLMGSIGKRLDSLQDTRASLFIEEENRFKDSVEGLEDEATTLRKELREARGRIKELEEKTYLDEANDELLSLVNEVLCDPDDEFSDLDSAVRALVDKYDDLLEESEDEG